MIFFSITTNSTYQWTDLTKQYVYTYIHYTYICDFISGLVTRCHCIGCRHQIGTISTVNNGRHKTPTYGKPLTGNTRRVRHSNAVIVPKIFNVNNRHLIVMRLTSTNVPKGQQLWLLLIPYVHRSICIIDNEIFWN